MDWACFFLFSSYENWFAIIVEIQTKQLFKFPLISNCFLFNFFVDTRTHTRFRLKMIKFKGNQDIFSIPYWLDLGWLTANARQSAYIIHEILSTFLVYLFIFSTFFFHLCLPSLSVLCKRALKKTGKKRSHNTWMMKTKKRADSDRRENKKK